MGFEHNIGRVNMSDYRLELGAIIGPSDTDRLYDLLSIISQGDELEITVDGDNSGQIDTLVNVLRNNDFDISNAERQDGRKRHLIAHRK